jgi:magnesium transporter
VAAREGAVTEEQGPSAGGESPAGARPAGAPASSAVSSAAQSPVPRAATAGAPVQSAGVPASYYFAADGEVKRDLSPTALAAALRDETGALWVDIDAGDRHAGAVLLNVFGFHPRAVEDALNPETRVKLDEYQTCLYIAMRGLQFCEHTDDPYDLETFNLCFFLGRNFLVTVHGEHSPAILAMNERLERTPEMFSTRGIPWVMHAIMDAAVDAYFPIVDQIDDFVDGLEERVFSRFDQTALRDVFAVKRVVLTLRRHLAPQREVFNILTNRPTEFLSAERQVYFRDIYDHVLRINDSLETYRELLSSVLDSYLSQVSNRLGQTSKALSVVATVTLPFVILSGMWGMNVDDIPLQHHAHAFWILLALQLAIGVSLLAVLKWRKVL